MPTMRHPDGRIWSVDVEGSTLRLAVILPGDDPIVRTRTLRDAVEARREADRLVAEQLADGFAPSGPAADAVDRLIAPWREQDPAFAIEEFVAPLRAHPRREELVLAIDGLAHVMVDRGGGTSSSDNARTEQNVAEARVVLGGADDAIDRVLVLALRAEPWGISERAAAILCERTPAFVVDALLSCMRAFVPRKNDLPGRAADVLETIGVDGAIERLIAFAADERWETASAAMRLLARHAADPRVFEVVWGARSRGESFEHSVMVACEQRRDPTTLPWLEGLAKKRRGPGWKERVKDAIERVRQ